jgi:hypothetical protein
MEETMKLVTKEQWDKLSPRSQGYVCYLQGNLPGSELKGIVNPYFKHTKQHRDFYEGEYDAVIETVESEG